VRRRKSCCVRVMDFNTENSNPYGFDLHRPSFKNSNLLFKVIKAIIIIITVECSLVGGCCRGDRSRGTHRWKSRRGMIQRGPC